MLGNLGRQLLVYWAVALLSTALAVEGAMAQGRSGRSPGTNAGGANSGRSDNGGQRDTQSNQSVKGATDAATAPLNALESGPGGYGDVRAYRTIPLKDSWNLQLDAGVDMGQQTTSKPAGDVNGRLGLGLRF